jgi:hypothetical protein
VRSAGDMFDLIVMENGMLCGAGMPPRGGPRPAATTDPEKIVRKPPEDDRGAFGERSETTCQVVWNGHDERRRTLRLGDLASEKGEPTMTEKVIVAIKSVEMLWRIWPRLLT